MTGTPPKATVTAWEPMAKAVIAPTGFREYDARWHYPDQINLPGLAAVGLGIGTQMQARGVRPDIVVGHDYRAYSPAVKDALITGLVHAGIRVHDIGMALSPMAYFAQFHLDVPAVAMVTASHNPNGWTGIKLGFDPPLTHGPDDMAELRDIVLNGDGQARDGGALLPVADVRAAYLDDLAGNIRLTRPLKVVCACGNGTAAAFAPHLLRRIGADVVPLHCTLDHSFPHYNPNPEALEMLHDMGAAVRDSGADLALGFDGDGDRCGVVDDTGQEIFADKVGVILARHYARTHPGCTIVADVKSTGLFGTDPVLQAHGVTADYWKTGHSHMKRRVQQLGALAGFEKSGHFFLGPPIGRGYDCGLRVAVEICRLLDAYPGRRLSELYADLPRTWTTPTMSPHAADQEKYRIVARIVARLRDLQALGGTLGGQAITDIVTVNGARVMLEGGGWALVRASSNTPNLVVVCESPKSDAQMRAIFADLDAVIRREPGVGDYDQSI